MAINISPMQSNLYAKHWGKEKEHALREGTGLTSGAQLNGKVRMLYDGVVITETLNLNDVIFFPMMTEGCYILQTHLTIKTASTAAGKLDVLLFSGTTVNDNHIGILQYDQPSDTETIYTSPYQTFDAVLCPKGSVLGIKLKSSGAVIDDGHFQVTVLYSSVA